MDNNTELQQLLTKLEESNRKQVAYARLQFIFSLIAVLCCAVLMITVMQYGPQIKQMLAEVQGLATQAQVVLGNLESVTNELAQVDLAGMVNNVDSLVTVSQTGVETTLEKINAIDFEALNSAIGDLAEVVEPLAKFFNVFR